MARPGGPCKFFARVSNSVALLFKTLMNSLLMVSLIKSLSKTQSWALNENLPTFCIDCSFTVQVNKSLFGSKDKECWNFELHSSMWSFENQITASLEFLIIISWQSTNGSPMWFLGWRCHMDHISGSLIQKTFMGVCDLRRQLKFRLPARSTHSRQEYQYAWMLFKIIRAYVLELFALAEG